MDQAQSDRHARLRACVHTCTQVLQFALPSPPAMPWPPPRRGVGLPGSHRKINGAFEVSAPLAGGGTTCNLMQPLFRFVPCVLIKYFQACYYARQHRDRWFVGSFDPLPSSYSTCLGRRRFFPLLDFRALFGLTALRIYFSFGGAALSALLLLLFPLQPADIGWPTGYGKQGSFLPF